jgi:class 3 adenylate cyclase
VPDLLSKSLESPDNVVEFPGMRARIVELGDLTVGELVSEPGWRWSTHVRPTVGGEWCQARHVGIILSGRLGIELRDGTRMEFGPNEVFDVPPEHDGFTVGDEPCVQIEWSGIRTFAGFPTGIQSRVLATLLFTDLVDSTTLAARLGDARWREILSNQFEAARVELERFGGREVKTTGDGMLARFEGPARALHCAAAIRRRAKGEGLQIRAGIHVGEVELVGEDLRGVTVHEAARIMSAAAPDEILVSDLTRALAGASGLAFEDRGTHTFKGLDGEWRLAAFLAEPERLPA